MQETRRRIVELLRVQGGQTVHDLARALELTRTAVTSHLARLQAEGFVSRRGLRAGARRPSVLYALTAEADALFPKAYEDFSASLLEEIKREGDGNLKVLLRRLGDRWIARDLPQVERLQGRDRLEQAKQILTERGFLPVLNRLGKGYVLREHNCPVMRLAVAHPEICDMIHRWLESLFGVPLERVNCMRQGDPFSAYRITAVPKRT